MLDDWLRDTGQLSRGPLSDAHLLAEAEHVWESAHTAELGSSTGMYGDYHPSSFAALGRYIERLRSIGVEPKHDFEL